MKYGRIKKHDQFNRLFRTGRRAYSESLTVIYAPAKEMSMGIALSKKYGHAVVRNRIKRLLRVAFSERGDALGRNYSVLLVPKMRDEYTLDAFRKGMDGCIRKINRAADSK